MGGDLGCRPVASDGTDLVIRRAVRLLEWLIEAPRSARQLADCAGLPADRLYYHLGQLEQAGLIEVAQYRRLVRGRVERVYAPAKTEPPGDDADPEETAAFLRSVLEATAMDITAAFQARQAGRRREVDLHRGALRLTDQALAELRGLDPGGPNAGRPARPPRCRPAAREPSMRDATPRAGLAVRASDAEREQTVALLQHNFADGRLTQAELEERASAAYAAQTRAQLRDLTADLPAAQQQPPRSGMVLDQRCWSSCCASTPQRPWSTGCYVAASGQPPLAPSSY